MSERAALPSVERLGPARLALAGPLTFATAAEVHARGLAALGAEPGQRIEMDCSGISAADSAGLAVLIDWLASAAGAGRRLHYRALPEGLLALARISEVDALLQDGVDGPPAAPPA